MSGTHREAEFLDASRAAQRQLHARSTNDVERTLTKRRLAAKDAYDSTMRNEVDRPRTDRLFIDEPDRP